METIVETIVETTRPRVVRAARLDLAHYDCGDDTPSCRPSRKARFGMLRLWRRHALVSSEPQGSIWHATIVETTRPRVVRAARLDLACYDCGDDTPSCRPSRKARFGMLRLWRREAKAGAKL